VHYPIIRRLVYWVFNGVSVASLVVFVLILDMWLHSYGEVGRWQINPRLVLKSYDGEVELADLPPRSSPDRWPPRWRGWIFCGIDYRVVDYGGGIERWLHVSNWVFAAGAAVLPALWCRQFRHRVIRRRRILQGLCIACGYDLRVGGDNCSECGTPRKSPIVA
jgi:hypothetical protein